jgi:hypothetical protein
VNHFGRCKDLLSISNFFFLFKKVDLQWLAGFIQ